MHFQKVFSSLSLFAFCLLLSISCKNGSTNDPLSDQSGWPVATISDVSQSIASGNSNMLFYIYLDKAAAKDVSVDYLLVDGSALASRDFTAASGTVVIPAGKTEASFAVNIIGDPSNLRRSNIQFTVQLSKPVTCTIGTSKTSGTIVTENGTYLPTDNSGYSTPLSYPGLTLVWSDEFSGTDLDLNTWNQETGNGSGGWGNNELEYYTNSTKNTFLSNGNLVVEARNETMSGFKYTSGRMTTQNKKIFKYGRIDIRAKLPVGKGMWPALWMLGNNISTVGWPTCGEMDIMELIGTYPSRVSATMHWSSAAGVHTSKGANYNLSTEDFSHQFHVYSLVWSQDLIKCYVDDNLYLTVTGSEQGMAINPFNASQFFIFNVAVGGDWPGAPDGTTRFPQRMFVDYVRVFQ